MVIDVLVWSALAAGVAAIAVAGWVLWFVLSLDPSEP